MDTNNKKYVKMIKRDFSVRAKWLTWESLFRRGLTIEAAEEKQSNRYYNKIRHFFNELIELEKEDFVNYLVERDFTEDKALELWSNASSDLIEEFDKFVNLFVLVTKPRNTTQEYWTEKGWRPEEALLKMKDFFSRGAQSTNLKRQDFTYDNWFCKTRAPGGRASHLTLMESNFISSVETDVIFELKKKKYDLIKFYSPCVDTELNQLYNKGNFLHDIAIDLKDTIYIIEYNGTYWHKDFFFDRRFTKEDYLFEIKKAYNCLLQVKRAKKMRYIILWERDFENTKQIIEFIDLMIASDDGRENAFISSRSIDQIFFKEHEKKIKKQIKQNLLFKNIVMTFANVSNCLSKQVAALAVRDGRIIESGVNGTPANFINCNDYFKMLHSQRQIKISFEDWIQTDSWKKEHHEWSNINEIHSEQALISRAAIDGVSLKNADIYVSLEPCIHCTKLLAALKPNRVYYVNKYDKSSEDSKRILNASKIVIEKI